MKLWIDTEFNEFGGELISLSLVNEQNMSLYITYKMNDTPGPWVAQHVMPILKSVPTPFPGYAYYDQTHDDAAHLIAQFINAQPGLPHIIADWPADIEYFCGALVVGPGQTVNIRRFITEVNRDLNYNSTEVKGAIAHNAFWDAKCIKVIYEKLYT